MRGDGQYVRPRLPQRPDRAHGPVRQRERGLPHAPEPVTPALLSTEGAHAGAVFINMHIVIVWAPHLRKLLPCAHK